MAELSDRLKDWDAQKFAERGNATKPSLLMHKFDEDEIAIALMGDTHIGSKFYNRELHRDMVDLCLKNKTPVILMGDNIEAATRDSVGAGVYEQQDIIDGQIEEFLEVYKPLAQAGLIMGMHTGNHEARVYKACGVDVAKLMADLLGVKYLGWSKLHYIKVKKQGYLLYTTHGSSGARMPHTKIKSCIDLNNMVDSEIFAMGHLHQITHHIKNFYKADLRRKTVGQAQKHFILTGAYLSHWGSYAHVNNMEPMRQGSPLLKLGGKKHQIEVSMLNE